MANALEVIGELTPDELERCWVWVATPRHVEKAAAAGARNFQYCLSASDAHNRANIGRTTTASLDAMPTAIATTREVGGRIQLCIATAFTCPFDGRVPLHRVLDIVTDPRTDGADDTVLCDTLGQAIPAQVTSLVRKATALVPQRRTVFHGHDTWGWVWPTPSPPSPPAQPSSTAPQMVGEGGPGRAAVLSTQERREVAEICSRVCRKYTVPLLVGAGSNDTAGTMRALEELHSEADVAGALVVVPYYTRASEAGVVAHFEYIAERSPLPLVLYNVPYRTGQYLGFESILRLSGHSQIVGIKQAVGAVDTDTARLLAELSDSFSVLAGEDALASPLLAMGAAGAILATANVCARDFVELFQLWRNGSTAQARDLGNQLVGPACALMADPNPTVIKAVLHAQGRISTPKCPAAVASR